MMGLDQASPASADYPLAAIRSTCVASESDPKRYWGKLAMDLYRGSANSQRISISIMLFVPFVHGRLQLSQPAFDKLLSGGLRPI